MVTPVVPLPSTTSRPHEALSVLQAKIANGARRVILACDDEEPLMFGPVTGGQMAMLAAWLMRVAPEVERG